jgi:hypothetical protein
MEEYRQMFPEEAYVPSHEELSWNDVPLSLLLTDAITNVPAKSAVEYERQRREQEESKVSPGSSSNFTYHVPIFSTPQEEKTFLYQRANNHCIRYLDMDEEDLESGGSSLLVSKYIARVMCQMQMVSVDEEVSEQRQHEWKQTILDMIPKFQEALRKDPENTLGHALLAQLRQIELSSEVHKFITESGIDQQGLAKMMKELLDEQRAVVERDPSCVLAHLLFIDQYATTQIASSAELKNFYTVCENALGWCRTRMDFDHVGGALVRAECVLHAVEATNPNASDPSNIRFDSNPHYMSTLQLMLQEPKNIERIFN